MLKVTGALRVYLDGKNGVQALYTDLGEIKRLDVFNPFVNDFIMAEVDQFMRQYPSRYNYIQEKINEQIELDKAFEAIQQERDCK